MPVPAPRSLRNKLAAGTTIVALLVCAGLGIAIAVKKRTPPPASIASAPDEVLVHSPTPVSVPAIPKPPIKKNKTGDGIKKAKPLEVEQLVVMPREFIHLAERDEYIFKTRPRNNVAAKLPAVEAPPLQRAAVMLGSGIPFHTDVPAAFDEAQRLNQFVFVVEHVGVLQDGRFSSKQAERFRVSALHKKPVTDHLLGAKKKIAFTCAIRIVDDKLPASDHVVVYLCQPGGIVLHALIDPTDEQLHKEIRWLEQAHDRARKPDKRRPIAYLDQIKAAHLRAPEDNEDESGKYGRRLHDMLAKTPHIDDLDDLIWKLLFD